MTTGRGRRGLTLVQASDGRDGTGSGDSLAWGARQDAREDDDRDEADRTRRRAAVAAFRRGVEAGTFDDLMGAPLRATITGGAREQGLEDEIGMLRLVMVRLLVEEDDLTRLVGGVARLATAITQATRLRRTIGSEAAGDLLETLTRVLTDLDDGAADGPGDRSSP